MMSTSTQSLSKGIFSFRGKKRKPSPKDFVESSCGLESQQLEHYEYLSNSFHKISQDIHADVSHDLFTELISYVSKCGKNRSRNEIHAAAVVTGVNTPDHSVLYDNILTKVREEVTPYVVLIESKCCSMKHIMQSIASQLNNENSPKRATDMPSSHCTWSHIENWYNSVELKSPSPKKSRKSIKRATSKKPGDSHSPQPIVLLFEAFSHLPVSCVQDLVLSCRNHLDKLPIVLVFGVSLSLSSLRSTLTHEVSTILSIEAFQLKSSSVYLSKIIEQMLLVSDLPFRLGGKALQLLLDNFLCHDFSIQKFLHSMQFCVMDHCLGSTSSATNVTRGHKHLKMDLDYIRQLMSFRKYVERETDPKVQIKLLEDSAYTKSKILSLIEDINVHHLKQPFILRCLHSITKCLPESGFGKQLREVYYCALSESFTSLLDEDFKLISNMSRQELQQQLTAILHILSACPVNFDLSQFNDVMYKLLNFEELLEKAESESSSTNQKSVLNGKKMDMYTLRKTLQQQRPRHVTLYEEIRKEAVDALYSFFTTEVIYYKEFPLHELFYYDDVKTLKSAVNALPRVAVFTALSKPHVYLQGVPELTNAQSISSQLPDTSVAFKLHLECSTMINMYDWMQAFISVHDKPTSKDEDQHLKHLCARFTHSAAEMQLLGFIRSTKRKTDHVSRLTWGTV